MENAKRGFVFYFDNYFVVEDLPPDQRGWLLSALCVYAERVWRDPSVTMEEILDHYPQMSGQTRIACGFLGAAVLRDTQRWLSQRQARALRRQQGDRPGRPPAPARERSWSREQDMELTRKLAARLRELSKTIGANLAPFDAWLLLRGIQTLAVRMDRAEENAMALAQWLKTRPEVTRVIYPGLPEHPGHALMKQQARGFGAMLTFEVRDKREVPVLLKAVRLIRFAESLGGTESLLTYPITQTHADVPPEVLAANGLTDRILRLSVGIENINDLRTDLEQAFAAVQAAL